MRPNFPVRTSLNKLDCNAASAGSAREFHP